MKYRDWQIAAALAVGVTLLYALFSWQLAITDPVESNYVLTAKEMMQRGDYMTPYIYGAPWFDKPIWTYWMLIISFKVFGINEFAARLPGLIAGGISVGSMYLGALNVLRGRKEALAAAAILATSFEFWYISHAVITDQYLFLFSLWIFFAAYRGLAEKRRRSIVLAYGAAALAVLTKGPVGLVLPGLICVLYIVLQRRWSALQILFYPPGIAVFLLLAVPWYLYMYCIHGATFIEGFLGLHNYVRATVSEHPKYNVWYYYLIIGVLGIWPWLMTIIQGIRSGKSRDSHTFAMLWLIGVVLFYSLMATKYITYTYISLIPLSLLGAVGLTAMEEKPHRLRHDIQLLLPSLLFFGGLIIAGVLFLPESKTALAYTAGAVLLWLALSWRYVDTVGKRAGQVVVVLLIIYTGITCPVSSVMDLRSAKSLATTMSASPDDEVYFFGNFQTSYVFYSGHPASLVTYSNSIGDDVWSRGKDVMPTVTPGELNERVSQNEGRHTMIVVLKEGDRERFLSHDTSSYFSYKGKVGDNLIYETP